MANSLVFAISGLVIMTIIQNKSTMATSAPKERQLSAPPPFLPETSPEPCKHRDEFCLPEDFEPSLLPWVSLFKCCKGMTCTFGTCIEDQPVCGTAGASCSTNDGSDNCCPSLECRHSKCCSGVFSFCTTSEDCCLTDQGAPISCNGDICTPCAVIGEHCGSNDQCCPGLFCYGFKCTSFTE